MTQGATREEALSNIREVVQMIMDEIREDGLPLPSASPEDLLIFDDTRVAISV